MTRDFHLFWAGQVTSAFGSVFTAIAMPVVAVRYLGASPAEVGVLVAAGSLPLLLFGLLIAAWVDRLPRRRPYLIGCDLVAAAALGCVMLGLAADRLTVWGLAVFAFVLGVLGVVIETAYFVHLRSLVDADDTVRARARLQGGEHAGGVLGRGLSGPAVLLSTVVPFLIDLVSYLASAASLALIKKPEPRRPAGETGRVSWRELSAGLRLMYREPFLRRLTPFVLGQQIVAGMILAALPSFLLTVLDVPTSLYGVIFVFLGVAAVAGTAVASRLADRVEASRLTVLAYLGVAITTLLLPFAGGALPIAAGLAALGIGLPYFFGAIANIGLTAFVTVTVDEEKLGRAGVSMQIVSVGALVSGSVGGGLLAQQIGIRPTLWIAALVSMATVVVLWPMLRAGRQGARAPASPVPGANDARGAAPSPANPAPTAVPLGDPS
jgi:predicted MFS family arabinose efflux permease